MPALRLAIRDDRFRKRDHGAARRGRRRANWFICGPLRPRDVGPIVEESTDTPPVRAMSVKSPIRSGSSADEALAAPGPASNSIWAAGKRLIRAPSLSRVQSIIGTLAGIVSITGATFSLVQASRPANTGDLVAIVQAAATRHSVPDATVEVLTTQNALVATLTPDATGRVMRELQEGVYLVRFSHPRYAAEVRRIQVLPRQTVEVRASLRAGSSSAIAHAVNGTVNAVRRAFRF
jgi:hypothetical protein